ncbi:MAG TPA: beta-N-acetylhexosaminidase [Burkholderiales bacterium]|nr:beta-N-acetylhexosaminidase [Burkholderiales bacterium]
MSRSIPLGPVVIDVESTQLNDEDHRRLLHPLTGGVILFTRNYQSPEQLSALTAEIHALREPALIIAVDHEGGRVQRFRSGFTRIPPMRKLGDAWDANPQHARHLAHELGFVLAAELRAHGVDLSFTPVLDIDHGNSSIIGDRSFHRKAEAVVELSSAFMQGLKQGGLSAVGKHFPGHGHVRADSHLELPIDERRYSELERDDLVPFKRLIESGLPAIMPAHVVYPDVDAKPAGFSEIWLKKILRGDLHFDGLIFSDDLSMEGARAFGDINTRAQAALDAGADMVLVCNDPAAVDELYATMRRPMPPVALLRLARLHGRAGAPTMVKLREDPVYAASLRAIAGLGHESGDLPLA